MGTKPVTERYREGQRFILQPSHAYAGETAELIRFEVINSSVVARMRLLSFMPGHEIVVFDPKEAKPIAPFRTVVSGIP